MNAYCEEVNLEDKTTDEKTDNLSKICIMHSRYASRKGTMRDNQANPVFDAKSRVAVFHNGFVTNFKDLTSELFPHKSKSKQTQTDSELIALMLGKSLDEGLDLRTAIINLVQNKLIGTWRMAIISTEDPSTLYVTKNVGPCFVGKSKDAIVIC